MTVVPIEGVRYWLDSVAQAFVAPGRPNLPLAPVTPDPTPDPQPSAQIYAGAKRLGATSYTIPSGARYVDPVNGSDSNAGGSDDPYKTMQKAVNTATALGGGTVACYSGTYFEKVSVANGATITIVAVPDAVVWLDGSRVYPTWTSNGNGTWTSAYTQDLARFSIAGYSGTDPYRGYTDQVWVDDVRLTQIADATTPGAGQFSVDQGANTITIGTSPVGKTVRCSELTGMTWLGKVTCLGVGIRGYTPQQLNDLSCMITMRGTSNGSLFENCWFAGSSISGLSLDRSDCIVRSCTFEDMMKNGMGGTTGSRNIVEKSYFRKINYGLYEQAPTTAAIKFTRTDNTIVRWNWFEDMPKANPIWFDVSCIQTSIYGNYVDGRDKGRGASYNGIFIEISDGGYVNGTQYSNWVVGNRVLGGRACLVNTDSSYGQWWNNEVSDYRSVGIELNQDDRLDNNEDPGNRTRDIAPWHNLHVALLNNKIGTTSETGSPIQLLSYCHAPSSMVPNGQPYLGWDMIDRLAGTWFQPAPPGSMTQLGKVDATRISYNTPAALTTSAAAVGGPPGAKLGPNYQGTAAPNAATYADPVPANVAAMLGVAPGTRMIGPNLANLPTLVAV